MSREGRRVQTPCNGVERTVQAPKGELDINQIMARYMKTGQITHLAKRTPKFGDFTVAQDLLSAYELQAQAEDEFQSLDSRIRRAANNSKEEFWRMLATEDGAMRLQEAGLELGLEVGGDEDLSPQKPSESDGVTKDISEQV